MMAHFHTGSHRFLFGNSENSSQQISDLLRDRHTISTDKVHDYLVPYSLDYENNRARRNSMPGQVFYDAVDDGRLDVVTDLVNRNGVTIDDCRLLDRATASGNVEMFLYLENLMKPSKKCMVEAYRFAFNEDIDLFTKVMQRAPDHRALPDLLFSINEKEVCVAARIIVDRIGPYCLEAMEHCLLLLVKHGNREGDMHRIRYLSGLSKVDKEKSFNAAIQLCEPELVKILCPHKPSKNSLNIAVSTGDSRIVSLLIKHGTYSSRALKKAAKIAKKQGHKELENQILIASKAMK